MATVIQVPYSNWFAKTSFKLEKTKQMKAHRIESNRSNHLKMRRTQDGKESVREGKKNHAKKMPRSIKCCIGKKQIPCTYVE